MTRSLPTLEEARLIFAAKRTRPARRPPPAAAGAVTRALKQLNARFGHGAEGLQAHWTEIVGKAMLGRTEPGRLLKSRQGSVLELKVDGPSAVLIQHQAPEILARVNLFLGAGAVTALRIVQSPPSLVPKRRSSSAAERLPTRHRPPLDAGLESGLARDLSSFSDGPLKAALLRLGREALRGSTHV